nr:hypothetical protein [Tanacetum cinerariifolium]
ELAKKIQAEQEAEFARQQEELAQKAHAESIASPTAHGQGMSDQRDDVTKENMNERLGMLLMRKRRELAEQSRVKPMTKTQQRDYMRDFVKNCSASVYNQGWTMNKVKTLSIDQLRLEFEYIQRHLERSNLLNFRRSTFRPKPTLDAPPAKRANQEAPQVPAVSTQDPVGVPAAPSIPADASLPAASSSDPAAIPVPAVSIAHAAVSVPAEPIVHSAASHMNDPLTTPEHGSSEPTVVAPTLSSSRHRRKHIAKKRVTPIVDVPIVHSAASHMDDPLTTLEHGSSEPTVVAPTLSSSRHRRKHIAKKRVTPIVDVADAVIIKFDSDSDSDDDPLPYAPYAGWEMVPSPLGSVHAYHNMAGHTKHFTTLRKILHMVERTDLQRLLDTSLDDMNALYFWRTQDSWRIRSWRLYPRAQVHALEMVDGWVSKLLVGGDLTMAEQLIGFINAALLNAKSAA